MMQMASKEKERGKRKKQASAAASRNLMTREEVERQGNRLYGCESMVNHSHRLNDIARTAVSLPRTVVNQPVDVSQMGISQGTQDSEATLEFSMLPSHLAQLTAGELALCREEQAAKRHEQEDIFANAGTHEMGAGEGLPPPSDNEDNNNEVKEEDEEDEKGPCQLKYEESNCKRTLNAMLLGLVDAEDRKLGDLTLEPHASMRQKSAFTPVLEDLKDEVTRRAKCNGSDPLPKPRWWSKTKAEKWLVENPTEALRDVEFLIETEAKVRAELENEVKEREQLQEERVKSNGNWNAMCPHLRLCCCMCDDRARDALLSKDDGWDRQELDARNHDDRPKTWCDVVAELCNDADNACETEALPELHPRSCEPIELKFEDMLGGEITGEQVRGRYGGSRALLVPMVHDWERSGNGFGQRSTQDSSWGHYSEEHQDGDNRGSFLHSDLANKEHLLYFWHLADTEGILKNMLNVLAKDVRIDCDGHMRVDTSQVQHKRKKPDDDAEQKDRQNFRAGLNQAMTSVAITAIRENLRATIAKAAECEVNALVEMNEKVRLVCERLQKQQEDIAKEIKEELDQEMSNREGLGYKKKKKDTDADVDEEQ